MNNQPSHIPVLKDEVVSGLSLKPGDVAIDATIGGGGHARLLLEAVGKRGTVIGVDKDADAIETVRQNLSRQQSNGQLCVVRGSYTDVSSIAADCGHQRVNAILFDLGLSTLQLEGTRGFSFLADAPLDMRFDNRGELTAEEIVNSYPKDDLADILYRFGEERASRRIAKAIVEARRQERITTTGRLAQIIQQAKGGRRGKLHPATLTFQALRIAVNDELRAIAQVLPQAFELLLPGGRLAVISYHSLEDRIVKNFFRDMKHQGQARLITKKPILASPTEIKDNPRSRSAKLRILEKI